MSGFTREIRVPQPGDDVAAADFAALVYEIRRGTPVPGKGILIDVGPAGSVISVARQIANIFAKAPSGGIPAMTGTGFPYTPNSADCEIGFFDGTNIVDAGYTATVWNSTKSIVGSSGKLLQCKVIDGVLWVDTQDSC